VSGLLAGLGTEAPGQLDTVEYEAARSKSAMLTAIAVMAIILSCLPLVILSILGSRYDVKIGIPIMFVAIAGAVGVLVYNNMTKPRNFKGSGTMVDQFREWQTGVDVRKTLRRAISTALWSILVALYFVISFWSDAWHITWIIFILGAAIEAFINIFFALKK
jgi:ABC-type bacteriocin/lantibiotic exporter with double-glycine peptidase domain